MFCSAWMHPSPSRCAAASPPQERAPSILSIIRWWATFVLATLVVAGLIKVAAPTWLSDVDASGVAAAVRMVAPTVGTKTVTLPNDPLLAGDIFFNNFLLVLLPLLGGWLSRTSAQAPRILRCGLLVLPAVIVGRSLLTVGAVGGADPAWLLDASRWWVLEVGALACGAHIGTWLAGSRHSRGDELNALRRGLLLSASLLVLAAAIEVFTG